MDVFEFIARSNSFRSDWVNHAIHWDGYEEHHKQIQKRVRPNVEPGGWHTFGMLWSPEGYRFFVDGEMTGEIDGPESDAQQYLILSVEYLPHKDEADDLESDEMLVDYVRAYEGFQPCGYR